METQFPKRLVPRKKEIQKKHPHPDMSAVPELERQALLDLGFNFDEIQPDRVVSLRNNHVISIKIHTAPFPSSTPLERLPDSIGQLSFLMFLYLNNNSLKSLPTNITLLKNLSRLELAYNLIQEFPAEIRSLLELDELDLSHNLISTIPDGVGEHPKLDELDLTANSISNLPDSLGKIYHIELSENSITLLPENFYQHPTTEHLYIGRNPLRSLSKIPPCSIYRQPYAYLSPFGFELYSSAARSGEYEPVLEYYSKHPMALARQFVEAEVFLTSEEEERLIFEAGPKEIAYLESFFPPHYPLMQKIAQRQYPPAETHARPTIAAIRLARMRKSKVKKTPVKITKEMLDEEFREYEKGTPLMRYVRKLNELEREDRNEPVHKTKANTDTGK